MNYTVLKWQFNGARNDLYTSGDIVISNEGEGVHSSGILCCCIPLETRLPPLQSSFELHGLAGAGSITSCGKLSGETQGKMGQNGGT